MAYLAFKHNGEVLIGRERYRQKIGGREAVTFSEPEIGPAWADECLEITDDEAASLDAGPVLGVLDAMDREAEELDHMGFSGKELRERAGAIQRWWTLADSKKRRGAESAPGSSTAAAGAVSHRRGA